MEEEKLICRVKELEREKSSKRLRVDTNTLTPGHHGEHRIVREQKKFGIDNPEIIYSCVNVDGNWQKVPVDMDIEYNSQTEEHTLTIQIGNKKFKVLLEEA